MSINVDEPIDNEPRKWEHFANWIHCICVVTFDLELGQALESVYPPHVQLTKQEITNICYLSFPDSNSGCMGDTSFVIRLPCCQLEPKPSTEAQSSYNKKCPPPLVINPAFYWGFVHFRQVKDPKLPRGYFQKSLVLLSKLPFNNLFTKVVSLIAPEYFANGLESLEAACGNINQWPEPTPGDALTLPLLGTVFQTYIPRQGNATSLLSLKSTTITDGSQIQTSVSDLDLFDILRPFLPHLLTLWELVLVAEPLVVMSSASPAACSSMVLALTRLIGPLAFCPDHRPYFTIHDADFKQFTTKTYAPPVILGVTNPFFGKTLHHWPHTIRLAEDCGQGVKYKLKKTINSSKIFDPSPGVYSTYKPFLQKDKAFIKNLTTSKRPSEVQTALLRKHLLELTHSFMIPLERYMASLMPFLRNISPFKAAPSPLPFNPDDFVATLDTAGPQLTTGIKGDWVGLYRRFFRSPNFNGWFNARYTELALKLQALQLEALAQADLKQWVQDKPEVEVVDMVLRIKNKIKKCEQMDSLKEDLEKRLADVICSLPDDLKHILVQAT